jgi:hypothetical protein
MTSQGGGGAVIHDFRLGLQADDVFRLLFVAQTGKFIVSVLRPPVCLTKNFSVSVRQ